MSLHCIMNPGGGVLVQRVVEGIHSGSNLLEQIFSTENVHEVWRRGRANKGAAGIDNVKMSDFPDLYRPKWREIKHSLMERAYTPSPVLRVEIPKPDGSKRPLGIPTVLDKLIQQSIAQVLSRIFDPGFSMHSYRIQARPFGASGRQSNAKGHP